MKLDYDLPCPACGEHTMTFEMEVTSWGHPGSYWEPPEGPEIEWQLKDKECAECKYELTEEDEEELDEKMNDLYSDGSLEKFFATNMPYEED